MAEIAGLKLIVPSSVAGSGVSVSASGKVSFTSATSVSVNGCFSATYDNYLFVTQMITSLSSAGVVARLRSAGTDATGSNYAVQVLAADSTTVSAARATGATFMNFFGVLFSDSPNGSHAYLYGPFLAQPTAHRSVAAGSGSGAYIYDAANTHSLSTSYDGITIYPNEGGNITGTLTIYGLSQ